MEERLGGLVADVVRVGDTVRRRVYRDLDVGFGEEILRRLEVAAFDAAPRFASGSATIGGISTQH